MIHSVEITEIYPHFKKISWNQFTVQLFSKKLLWRHFCKIVWEFYVKSFCVQQWDTYQLGWGQGSEPATSWRWPHSSPTTPQWTPGGNGSIKEIRSTNSALKTSQWKMRWFWDKSSSFLKNLQKKLIFHFKLWLPGPITLLQEVGRQVSN